MENQQGLFSTEELNSGVDMSAYDTLLYAEEYQDEELEQFERQLLGFSLSAKPLDELLSTLSPLATHTITDIEEEGNQKLVKVAAVVSEVRVVVTKKSGKEMAFVRVNDTTGSIDLVVFPKTYDIARSFLEQNKPLLISGKVDTRDEGTSLLVDTVQTEEMVGDDVTKIYIRVPKEATADNLRALKQVLLQNNGTQKVALVFEGKGNKHLDLDITIEWNKSVAAQITHCFDVPSDHT